ncbi:Uncharacterised protein [Mycobacteroides abscessus subsp. abscessus]|nr:Uncharacterised protein [Mycobacteroides abscessus subsp. abscessus]
MAEFMRYEDFGIFFFQELKSKVNKRITGRESCTVAVANTSQQVDSKIFVKVKIGTAFL